MSQKQNYQAEGTGSSLTPVAIQDDLTTSRSELEMKNTKGMTDSTITITTNNNNDNDDDDDDKNETTTPTTTTSSSSSNRQAHSCHVLTNSKSDREKVRELEEKATEILSKENMEAKLARRKRRRQQMNTVDEQCAGCGICCADCCGECCIIM